MEILKCLEIWKFPFIYTKIEKVTNVVKKISAFCSKMSIIRLKCLISGYYRQLHQQNERSFRASFSPLFVDFLCTVFLTYFNSIFSKYCFISVKIKSLEQTKTILRKYNKIRKAYLSQVTKTKHDSYMHWETFFAKKTPSQMFSMVLTMPPNLYSNL